MLSAKEQLRSILNRQVSDANLAFKWAPREKSAKKLEAKALRNALDMTPKEYRQFLSQNTFTTERLMCAKDWNEINFSHVPSLAAARYQKAFQRNASVKYAEYIRELQKAPEDRDANVKINAGAVYPYDVVKSLMQGVPAVADAQFAALPDYVGGRAILPMVDVSGSMSVQLAGGLTAMQVALSLGLYLSDRTNSDFKDMFMTFTDKPKLHKLNGTLSQKMAAMKQQVAYNTNIQAAFEELLRVSVKHKVPQENMPEVLLILSDMQFDDYAIDGNSVTAFEGAKRQFAEQGYKLPNVVFWNLAARESARQSPIKMHDTGAALVSGFSPAIMAAVLGADPNEFSPYTIMLKALMSDRYAF